ALVLEETRLVDAVPSFFVASLRNEPCMLYLCPRPLFYQETPYDSMSVTDMQGASTPLLKDKESEGEADGDSVSDTPAPASVYTLPPALEAAFPEIDPGLDLDDPMPCPDVDAAYLAFCREIQHKLTAPAPARLHRRQRAGDQPTRAGVSRGYASLTATSAMCLADLPSGYVIDPPASQELMQ
ncbi:hypothetical protein KIPB_014728, partial [Kipferlia bialata]